MINKIRDRFTRWYAAKGYLFWCDAFVTGEDGVKDFARPINPKWECPFWVRPLLIFFKTDTYVFIYLVKKHLDRIEAPLRKNGEGYDDPTAYAAIKNIEG